MQGSKITKMKWQPGKVKKEDSSLKITQFTGAGTQTVGITDMFTEFTLRCINYLYPQ